MFADKQDSRMKPSLTLLMILAFGLSLSGCQEKRESRAASSNTGEENPPPSAAPESAAPSRFIYVASGACYGGDTAAGAVSTGSNTVTRYDLNSGAFDSIIVDYNTFGFGDAPAGLLDYDADHLLVFVENTGGRRIDLLNKKTGATQTFLTNSNLNGAARAFVRLDDGGFLISKSTAIERFNSNGNRITIGSSPYVSAPAGNCATSTVRITSVTTLPSGKIVFVHANTSPNKKIAVISSSGYSGAGSCLAGVTIPTTTAMPTAVLREQGSSHVLVAAGSSTPSSNFIQSYLVNDSTGAISAPVAAWTDYGYVSAPSVMIQDQSTAAIYVANARSTFNSVERFTYNPTSRTLERNDPTFLKNSLYTRCIAGLAIGN